MLHELNQAIVACERCPRLREWCQHISAEKTARFRDWEYWGRPVPNFGDPDATRLIVGLAPAAHGANRTGRMFTGDRSGDWLYDGLFEVGLASQPHATSADDGLFLRGVLITASVHCAPPGNKPTPQEIQNCRPYLAQIIHHRPWKSILCLGGIAWKQVGTVLEIKTMPKFGHGVMHQAGTTLLLGSYHPSQQNTFTGRLTRPMLLQVLRQFSLAGC